MFANLRYFLLPVLNITGPVLIAFACLLLLPVFVSSLYNDGAAYGFEIAFVLCLITGLTLYVFTKRHRRELLRRFFARNHHLGGHAAFRRHPSDARNSRHILYTRLFRIHEWHHDDVCNRAFRLE